MDAITATLLEAATGGVVLDREQAVMRLKYLRIIGGPEALEDCPATYKCSEAQLPALVGDLDQHSETLTSPMDIACVEQMRVEMIVASETLPDDLSPGDFA